MCIFPPYSAPIGHAHIRMRRYEYAGALDAMASTAAGALVLLDFKTSSRMQESYAMQVNELIFKTMS